MFSIPEIEAWLKERSREVDSSIFELVIERGSATGELASIFADFISLGRAGRIGGNVQGYFEFHVVDGDLSTLFIKQLKASRLEELDDVYGEFRAILCQEKDELL